MATTDSLIYLYGVVPSDAPAPPSELRGLDGAPVRLLSGDGGAVGLAALVSELPAASYAEAALDARLADLQWVGERGIAHERVLTWYADRGAVVPLSPFSLHQDAARVRERLAEDAERFRQLLARLAGRREWGIKLWRDDAVVTEHLAELSPRFGELARELESATPGRRFLLTKKLDALRADELRSAGARVARETFEVLAARAEAAERLPLAAGAQGGARTLVLHAAFLVPEAQYAGFEDAVNDVARRYRALGFAIDFTGPWPAYHFARPA
jgi:hypothetical protein